VVGAPRRVEDRPARADGAGVSRHVVRFVAYDDRVYALKEADPGRRGASTGC